MAAVARGHDTIAAVTQAVSIISQRNAERLLTWLAAMTLFGRIGDCFMNATDGERF